MHALAGVTWVGLLYYFNFVQVPAMADALADEGGPGPAAIGKYIAPRALLWFRMASAVTWLTGAWALINLTTIWFCRNIYFSSASWTHDEPWCLDGNNNAL